MVIIKWTNKYSNETGYVASLSTKNECFINTFEEENAKDLRKVSCRNNEKARSISRNRR